MKNTLNKIIFFILVVNVFVFLIGKEEFIFFLLCQVGNLNQRSNILRQLEQILPVGIDFALYDFS